MKRLAVVIAAVLAGFGSAACNTVHGIGQDISATGEIIQKAVK